MSLNLVFRCQPKVRRGKGPKLRIHSLKSSSIDERGSYDSELFPITFNLRKRIPCFHLSIQIPNETRLDRDPSSLKIFDSRNGGEETLGFEVASITLPDTQQVPTFTVSPIRNCLAIMKRSRETVFHEISRRGVKQSGRVNDTSNTLEKICEYLRWSPGRSMQMLFMEIATFEIARNIWKSLNICMSGDRKLSYR